jgi:hypothetical protein
LPFCLPNPPTFCSIIYTYEDSGELPVADMLKPENIMAITARAFTLCFSAM